MLQELRTAFALQCFVEAIKWNVTVTDGLVSEALSMCKVEITEVPVLESFLSLCHDALCIVITPAKVSK